MGHRPHALGAGDLIAFDPTTLHAVHNDGPVFSAGTHLFAPSGREVVVYFVLGPGKTLLTFPGMPPAVQACLDDLGLPTTARLAEGGAEGAAELRRLVSAALREARAGA